MGGCRVVIAGAFEEDADILDSETIFQQQNHSDEGNREGIELQTGPYSMNGVIRAFQGAHKRRSNPIFMLGDEFSATVTNGNHGGGDQSLVAHRTPLLALFAVVGGVTLVTGGLLFRPLNRRSH